MIKRDLRLYCQQWGECLTPVFFFTVVVTLFPMGVGVAPKLLARIAPAVIWIAVVLSLLMSLENIFRQDYQEGSLEQMILSPYPLPILLLGKSIAHWLMIGLPLFILAPLLHMLLQGASEGLGVLALTLLLAIPTLSLMGSMGAALTIGLPNGGALLAVLVLPMMIPVVIFGTSALTAVIEGVSFDLELYMLAALFVLTLTLGPIALSNAVRASVAS